MILVGASPLIWKSGIFLYSLSKNFNPDHVELEKDGWYRFLSFVTEKNKIYVEIYGHPIDNEELHQFVVIRKGILPFGLKLISPVYDEVDCWSPGWNGNQTMEGKPDRYSFDAFLGLGNFRDNESKYTFTPFISFVIINTTEKDSFEMFSFDYSHCDEIPTIINLRKAWGYGKIKEYWSAESITIYNEIRKAIPLKENVWKKYYRW